MEGYEIPVNYVPCQPIDGLARLGVRLSRTTKRGPEHSTGRESKGSRREPLPDGRPSQPTLGASGFKPAALPTFRRKRAFSGSFRCGSSSSRSCLTMFSR